MLTASCAALIAILAGVPQATDPHTYPTLYKITKLANRCERGQSSACGYLQRKCDRVERAGTLEPA
jgi:hypothetical protein